MFNVVALGDGQVGLYALDVTGEGVPAALLATTLSRILAPASDPTSILVARNADGSVARVREPAEVAQELNQRFSLREGRQYFTLAYGVLHLESRRFEFTSAGHPPLLHLQTGRAPTMLYLEGFPIGMAPESEPFQQRSVVLQPGDRILIYSDGAPDAMRGDGEVFGTAGLLDAGQRFSSEPLDGLIGCLLGELRHWRGDAAANEDMSILGFEVS
jgi:sigma-B regulation protein RsbU (phosphoserine phosphatase)